MFLFVMLCVVYNGYAQQQRIANQTLPSGWTFGVNSGVSFVEKSNENSLFRGNGIATQMFGRYYFGNVGIGVTSGIVAGAINNAALNKFLTERKWQQGQISKSNPFNSYFLFGPSYKFGERVMVNAELQGGIFINNPGQYCYQPAGYCSFLIPF